MSEFPDLEIGLHRREEGSYAVEFRFIMPGSDTDIRIGGTDQVLAKFDLKKLRSLALDSDEYGKSLAEGLFSDPSVKASFLQARSSAQSQDFPLRLRLLIGPSAPELHSLHWELLRDPEDGSGLFSGENMFFSRYLSSLDWRPVRLRPKRELKALVVVADPKNLGEYELADIDSEAELERAVNSLGDIQVECLPDLSDRARMKSIASRIRDTHFDLLYLVCHGKLGDDEPWIFLEDDEGYVDAISGIDFVDQIKRMRNLPRLIVLASCESALDLGEGSLAALGPRLAVAGVPAVIAMQGKISVDTVSGFMPEFFTELQKDGQIDRAVSIARNTVKDRSDYWMPALFMRLKSGRIWYVPGFGEEKDGFKKWEVLVRRIEKGRCTPILGPGLTEPLFGSLRDIAQRWAESYNYPLAPHERESLPQVSQYLAVTQDDIFPYEELSEYLQAYIQDEYQDQLPKELLNQSASLDQLIDNVGGFHRKSDPNDPYKILAALPLPIYITTNVHNLMCTALQESGKDPQVLLCPWNEYVEQGQAELIGEGDYRPSVERPLVYHLFGKLDEPDSIVLTEDDYFDYLIGTTSNKDIIPNYIGRALSDNTLLLLGFQMDDWNFRVLFRSILSYQGGTSRFKKDSVAAQVEPEEGRLLEPVGAINYLEKYFEGQRINLYWGSAADFVKDLQEHGEFQLP